MSHQTVLLPKWCTPWVIILAKGQLGHSLILFELCLCPIMIFSPVANFGDQSLIASKKVGKFSNFCGLLRISELYFFFRGAIMRLKGQILLDVLRMKVILIMTCTWPY